MLVVAKWLRRWFVVPVFAGSSPVDQPEENMTVSELIEELEKMDSDMPVYVDTNGEFFEVSEITSDEKGDVNCFILLGETVELEENDDE